ncbi:hypothetical protein LAD12857_28650 [Lacrimispora amygdalina]|uniref:Uncharacterized protein n=1 Tax=Lacrimispora amygdalina TaxID=253257 RepID=A0ABQ5M869_9FIRM
MNKKIEMEIEEETMHNFFLGLEQCLNDEEMAPEQENILVVMTIDDFEYLRSHEQDKPFIAAFLEQLEDFSVEQLEHLLSLTTPQLNIKTAKKYFCGKETA